MKMVKSTWFWFNFDELQVWEEELLLVQDVQPGGRCRSKTIASSQTMQPESQTNVRFLRFHRRGHKYVFDPQTDLMISTFPAVPEPLHGGAAFANFIFDLAKQMKPEAAFGGQMIYFWHQIVYESDWSHCISFINFIVKNTCCYWSTGSEPDEKNLKLYLIKAILCSTLQKKNLMENNSICKIFIGDGDSELANLIGLRERLGNEVISITETPFYNLQ